MVRLHRCGRSGRQRGGGCRSGQGRCPDLAPHPEGEGGESGGWGHTGRGCREAGEGGSRTLGLLRSQTASVAGSEDKRLPAVGGPQHPRVAAQSRRSFWGSREGRGPEAARPRRPEEATRSIPGPPTPGRVPAEGSPRGGGVSVRVPTPRRPAPRATCGVGRPGPLSRAAAPPPRVAPPEQTQLSAGLACRPAPQTFGPRAGA